MRFARGDNRRRRGTVIHWLNEHGLFAALSLGAFAGAIDVMHAGWRRTVDGRLVFVPEFFWWTAPLVNALLVSAVTLLIVVVVGRIQPRWRRATSYAVPSMFAALSILLHVPGVHVIALALLAAGVGIRTGVLLVARAPLVDRLALWSLPILLVLIPAGATYVFGLNAPVPARAHVARAGLPNVVVIILDTVRAIEMSLYGAAQPTTPVIDRLGREGVVFDRASSTAPWTLPSHASVFTGRWPHELSAGLLTPLNESPPTLAEALSNLGYATVGFSANVEYASRETGVARGFHHWEDHRWSLRGLLQLTELSRLLSGVIPDKERDQPGRVDAALINRRMLSWLDEKQDDRPFFAFLNYYDAHAPYYPPESQWTRFVGTERRRPLVNRDDLAGDSGEVQLMRRAYAAALNSIDEQIGILTEHLRARGELDRTIIVITADHGEEFAEHGLLGHGNTLYRPSIHVPLIVRWPASVPTNARISDPVSTRDIPATIMDLIGASSAFPGRSLRTEWVARDTLAPAVFTYTERAINQPPHFPASRGPLAGVEIPGYRLIVEMEPFAASLFDQRTDPAEARNLAGSPAHQPVLRALLDSLKAAQVPIKTVD